ncbi:MAG: DNA-binding protein Alba [Candidatus Bathyarchaeia archaeon]
MVENVVKVGKKPTMNYVVACVTILNSGAKELTVRARGQAISKAVDAVETLRRAFIKDIKIESVKIGSEEITFPDGTKSNTSVIEILIKK